MEVLIRKNWAAGFTDSGTGNYCCVFYRDPSFLIILLIWVSLGCSENGPVIGKGCMEDEHCCEPNEQGVCADGLYCDNTANPGQCLKVCNETSECIGHALGDNNACVLFDFGGRCMRLCNDDEECGEKTLCMNVQEVSRIVALTDHVVCYPCPFCDE